MAVAIRLLAKTMNVHHYTEEQYKRDCEERNAAFEAKHGREMNWDDYVRMIGGRFGGASIIARDKSMTSSSQDDGLMPYQQT